MLSNTGKAYVLWWQFLRRTNYDDWTPEIKKDFKEALTMGFADWFNEHRWNLFFGKTTDENFRVRGLKPGDDWNPDHTLALLLNLRRPKDQLLERIETFIDRHTDKKRGRPPMVKRHAEYDFARPPDSTALEITLHIHDLERDNPDLSRWQIMSKAQEHYPLLPNQKLKKSDSPKQAAEKKKVLSAAAGRYLARAKRIKEGVCKGEFPSL